MSLHLHVVSAVRSAETCCEPRASTRKTARLAIATTSRSPPGVQPRPPGSPSISATVSTDPSGATLSTRPARFSDRNSRPACQRGLSGKARPESTTSKPDAIIRYTNLWPRTTREGPEKAQRRPTRRAARRGTHGRRPAGDRRRRTHQRADRRVRRLPRRRSPRPPPAAHQGHQGADTDPDGRQALP